jgi:hypothetical protein
VRGEEVGQNPHPQMQTDLREPVARHNLKKRSIICPESQ